MLKQNRKVLSLALAVALIVSFSAPVFAAGATDTVSLAARFVVGVQSYTVYQGCSVTGAVYAMDAAPYIEDGRTLVPVRYLADALGAKTAWDETTQKVTVTEGSTTIMLTIGSTALAVSGTARQMDVAPVIRDGRTYLPARYVAEALGAKVDWDQDSQTVTITLGDAAVPPITPPVVQPATGQIDMAAAVSGTLQPPAGAVATPSDWGFDPQAREIAFTVGKQTATLTGLDGSTRAFDLGTAPMMIANSKNAAVDDLTKNNPNVYKIGETLKIDPDGPVGALYAPFIPIAEAFGVPAANIEWDGMHLAVFGMYSHVGNYRVLTGGSRDVICKVEGSNPVVSVSSNALYFPLVVLNGQPALGLTSISDFDGMLFACPGTPNTINAGQNGNHWDYETGTAAVGCSPQ